MAYAGISLLWRTTENRVLRGACCQRNECTQPPSLSSCCIGFSFTGHPAGLCDCVDFPAFPRLFSPGAGSSFGKQWPSHGPWPSEFMASWFPVFPCVLLMCCADWNNTVCVQANPQSPAVLWQRFQGGNASLALFECTCPCPSWDAPAVHLFHSGSSVFLFPQALIPPLLSPSPEQLPALMEGLPVPFSWMAAACIRELQKLSTSWAVKLCCFKVTLTWVLQQTCTASAATVSHEGAAVKY